MISCILHWYRSKRDIKRANRLISSFTEAEVVQTSYQIYSYDKELDIVGYYGGGPNLQAVTNSCEYLNKRSLKKIRDKRHFFIVTRVTRLCVDGIYRAYENEEDFKKMLASYIERSLARRERNEGV